jgi:hypothetical protein
LAENNFKKYFQENHFFTVTKGNLIKFTPVSAKKTPEVATLPATKTAAFPNMLSIELIESSTILPIPFVAL